MKKLFLAAGAALALLASCNKETEMINPAPETHPDGRFGNDHPLFGG